MEPNNIVQIQSLQVHRNTIKLFSDNPVMYNNMKFKINITDDIVKKYPLMATKYAKNN